MIAHKISILIFLRKNIKYIRAQKGLSQEEFAENLNVSRSRISSYEGNRAMPPIQFIIDLSNYVHISIDTLLRKKLDNLDF